MRGVCDRIRQEALVETQRTGRSSDDDTATKPSASSSATAGPGHQTGSVASDGACRVMLLDGNQIDIPLQVGNKGSPYSTAEQTDRQADRSQPCVTLPLWVKGKGSP